MLRALATHWRRHAALHCVHMCIKLMNDDDEDDHTKGFSYTYMQSMTPAHPTFPPSTHRTSRSAVRAAATARCARWRASVWYLVRTLQPSHQGRATANQPAAQRR
jgi:hypothetical protein